MKIEKKNIKDIILNNYNPNKIDNKTFNSLVENIKRFGYIQPILIDNNNVVIDGEHRFKACLEIGINEIECVIFDSDESVNEYKKLLTLSMNNLRGSNIEDKFEEVIKDISNNIPLDEISLLTGFDEKEINKIFNDFNSDKIKDLSANMIKEYEVIIECQNENQQENIYNKMIKEGYKCRILTL